MAVNIFCHQDARGSDEEQAAEVLKKLFEDEWGINQTVGDGTACVDIHVRAFVRAKGKPVEEIDLLVAIECSRQ